MKRSFYTWALILMMGASFHSVNAQNVELSRSDSVSYAAGMNYTIAGVNIAAIVTAVAACFTKKSKA